MTTHLRNPFKAPVVAAFVIGSLMAVPSAQADSVLMSPDWAKEACPAWNADPVLTDELVKSEWVKNDKGRGYKVIHLYRTDCAGSPRAELRIALQENKARCVYGGPVEKEKLDLDADYVMHAETKRWEQMGKGEYGPMWAMMTFRLKFDGPYGEAMGNMGPFSNFLLLAGKVPSDKSTCPK